MIAIASTPPSRGSATPAPAHPPREVADHLPDHLPASGHNAGLDGLRAVAALLILVFHVASITGLLTHQGALPLLLERGDVGVAIFFALSGFLLYRPWARAALGRAPVPATGRYLARRAVRILPAYWVLVAVALPVFSAGHLGDVWTWVALATLTFVYDPQPWWGGSGPVGLGHMWSLSVEVTFYLTLPLIAWSLARLARRGTDARGRARRLLAGVAVAGAAGYVFTFFQYHPVFRPSLTYWLPQSLPWFAVGMAVAVLAEWAHAEPGPDGPVRRLCRTLAGSPGLCWLAAGLTYAIAAAAVGGTVSVNPIDPWSAYLKLTLHAAVAFFVIVPLALQPARPAPAAALLGSRTMRFLGEISYGIFLWQLVALLLWYQLTSEWSGTAAFLVGLPVVAAASVALAVASYWIVEQPVRARYLSRRREPAPRQAHPPATGAESVPAAAP